MDVLKKNGLQYLKMRTLQLKHHHLQSHHVFDDIAFSDTIQKI